MIRSACNPILRRADIPAVLPHLRDVTSVFNPGAISEGGRTLLMLRVQTRGRETVLMPAWSDDGERFTVEPRLVTLDGLDRAGETVYHVYDPRLTRIDDAVYMVCAVDVDGACRLCIGRTTDFERFELVSYTGDRDVRNGVLFPEKVGGRHVRLERPNKTLLSNGVTTGNEVWLSESSDLREWELVSPVMAGRLHYWDELIGSGPPPVKTREGWLHVYHGVATHFAASNIYQMGVSLLDLRDPSKVLARGRNNVLEPREAYELTGQVPNVVFPSGMVVEEFDGEGYARPDSPVRVYYGAADTVVGMAMTTVGELLREAQV